MGGSEKFYTGTKIIKKTTLIDFSNILYSTFYGSVGAKNVLDEEKVAMWRYFIFNTLLKIKRVTKADEIVLCMDDSSKKYWRREVFPYYKAKRSIDRAKSTIDYDKFFESVDIFVDDLKNIPFKQVKVPGAEGDDCIAILCEYLTSNREQITVVSVDKDLQQLQRYSNVVCYNPVTDQFVKCEDTHTFLMMHIIKGDSGDGVPNILSEDNIFMQDGKRQKSITQKKLDEMLDIGLEEWLIRNQLVDNYERNRTMVELSSEIIPKSIKHDIIYSYNNYEKPSGNLYMNVAGLMDKYNIRGLKDRIGDFL